jgi:ribokinase
MPRVTVFGSLHYDIMVGAPAHPRTGETVAGHWWLPKCGGKGGNQAVAAAKAGVATAMIGAVADDAFGQALLANLDRTGVDRRFVRVEHGSATGMSVAISNAQGDYGAVIVSGANLSLSAHDVAAAQQIIAGTDIMVLQNEVPDAANVAAAQAMRGGAGRVLFNAAPARLPSPALAAAVDIIVVNAIEAELLAKVPVVETLEAALAAARLLAEDYPVAVVTAGGQGVACASRDGAEIAIEGVKVRVESTHGAGDEFIGYLAASLAAGEPIEAALRNANRAAALLVGTPRAERS